MPHISRIKLDKQAEAKLIESLELVLSKISSQESTHSFLMALLTPTERLMLAKRLAAVILIREGLSHQQISNTLHLTRMTISKLELYFEARGKGYEIAFKVLENEKLMKELKNFLFKLAGYTIRASGGYVKPTII